MNNASKINRQPRVGLFVTCLVDLFRPSVGFSALHLLEDAGCEVSVPEGQTCCGQPAYNMGEKAGAADLARMTIASFEAFDYVVAPSGSCAGMLKHHYPGLLADDKDWSPRAVAFSNKVHELVSFLHDVMGVQSVNVRLNRQATYHDACSGLRELGIRDQPRALLNSVKGLTLRELTDPQSCCGFGGTFSVNFEDISNAIVEKKVADVLGKDPDLLIGGDLGCLMNMDGKLKRMGADVEVRHVAEVLAGDVGPHKPRQPHQSNRPHKPHKRAQKVSGSTERPRD